MIDDVPLDSERRALGLGGGERVMFGVLRRGAAGGRRLWRALPASQGANSSPELHFDKNLIHVKRQIALETGKITWPMDDDGRWVPMTPAWREHLERMPRMGTVVNDMGEIVFPSPQGGYMWRSTWSSWWEAISAATSATVAGPSNDGRPKPLLRLKAASRALLGGNV